MRSLSPNAVDSLGGGTCFFTGHSAWHSHGLLVDSKWESLYSLPTPAPPELPDPSEINYSQWLIGSNRKGVVKWNPYPFPSHMYALRHITLHRSVSTAIPTVKNTLSIVFFAHTTLTGCIQQEPSWEVNSYDDFGIKDRCALNVHNVHSARITLILIKYLLSIVVSLS